MCTIPGAWHDHGVRDDFEDDRARERARRVVEYVGISGVGVLASRAGHIKLASREHPALHAAVEGIAAAWRAHSLAEPSPHLGRAPAHSPSQGSAPDTICVGACADGMHVLAAPVGHWDLLVVVLLAGGIPNTELRVRLLRAAELLERFSSGQARPGPSGSGAPATANVHVEDGRSLRRERLRQS